MSKEIKGNIEYSLTISDDGKWDIKYGSTIHNDMASLAIAQYVMESIAVNLREEKNNASGKVKKAYAAKLDKAISGRFGVQVICDYMLDNYIPYMKYLEQNEKETLKKDSNKLNEMTDEEILQPRLSTDEIARINEIINTSPVFNNEKDSPK